MLYMQPKNIALLVNQVHPEKGILKFVSEFLKSPDSKVSIYLAKNAGSNNFSQKGFPPITDALTFKFIENEIDFSITEVDDDIFKNIEQKAYYYDLIIISSSLLNQTTNMQIPDLKSPVIWIPENFSGIHNLLMLLRPSTDSVGTIKKFCQLFSFSCKTSQVTLLNLFAKDEIESPENELVNYLRGYCKNLGVFHCQQKLESKTLKALEVTPTTLIIDANGTNGSVINEINICLGSFTPFFTS
jgi:hypothetical protein